MLTATDFYKTDHRSQYPKRTQYVYSNETPRSDKYAKTDRVVVLGIQRLVIKSLIEDFNAKFFKLPKEVAVARYKRRIENALGKGSITFEHVAALWEKGFLPLRIKALPEGSVVPMKIPVMTIINTDPEFFWLTNYIETMASAETWGPMTSASIALAYRQILDKYAKLTGTPDYLVKLQGHDFSFRGMYGIEAAAMSGIGHLSSFCGTDTIHAIDEVEDYYGGNSDKELIGTSVPATEHAVMCMGTKVDEQETFRRLIEDLYPNGIVSIVSDTWDLWKVLTEYAPALKDKIQARKPITDESGNVIIPAKTVFRPDSGCPVKILTGYIHSDCIYSSVEDVYKDYDYVFSTDVEAVCINGKYFELHTDSLDGRVSIGKELQECEVKGVVETLWDNFPGIVNEKGFKQLVEVGAIYGDSITIERADQILKRLADKGFASGNVVLGIGSYTYQYNTRDTYGFAIKATWGVVSVESRNISKDPVTDDGTKKSATGLLRVELDENGNYILFEQQDTDEGGLLETIFEDGVITKFTKFEEIRARIDEYVASEKHWVIK